MPAYFDCGFSVREPSWHGQETVLDEYPTDWAEARVLAGLDWEPQAVPAYGLQHLTLAQLAALPEGTAYRVNAEGSVPSTYSRPDAKYPVMVQEPDHQRIVRSDTGATLAIPTDSYSLINHADMGELIEAFLGTDANLQFETAGSVRDGKQVWALVRLDEPYEVPGDSSLVYPFLAMLNAHDGSAACSLTLTDVRVVCWNTWTAADARGAANGSRLVIRHTGNVAERIADVKEGVKAMREQADANRALFAELAKTPVRPEQVMDFTEQFLPSPRDTGEVCTDRVHANVVAARSAFGRIHEQSATTDGIRGTAYGLLMTATEYLDHVRGFRTRDSYVGRTILRPERAKAAALQLIGEVTSN
jgi:phage/plasmid-like protein (TIGR03299 family)